MRGMIITVLVSLLLVLLIGFFCAFSSRRLSDDFQIRVEEIIAEIHLQRWERALQLTREAEKYWEEKSMLLSMWVNHQDVDQVATGLAQLRISISQQQTYHALLYADEINAALSLIYQRDAFSLKNIL